jgi:hypothetical protein
MDIEGTKEIVDALGELAVALIEQPQAAAGQYMDLMEYWSGESKIRISQKMTDALADLSNLAKEAAGHSTGIANEMSEWLQLDTGSSVIFMNPELLEAGRGRGLLSGFLGSGGFWAGSGSVSGSLFSAAAAGALGPLAYAASVDFLGYEASGSAAAVWGDGRFGAMAAGHAEVYLARFEASADIAGLHAAAHGYIGAEADAAASMMFDPLGGDAYLAGSIGGFAGARASASADYAADLGLMEARAGAHGEVWAGIGFEASGDIGFHEGVFNLEFDFGAALGIGASYGFDLELDFSSAADRIGDLASGIGDVMSDAGSAVGGFLGDVGGGIASGVSKLKFW